MVLPNGEWEGISYDPQAAIRRSKSSSDYARRWEVERGKDFPALHPTFVMSMFHLGMKVEAFTPPGEPLPPVILELERVFNDGSKTEAIEKVIEANEHAKSNS